MEVGDDHRHELERRADRHLRRGELRDALALYDALVEAFPLDASLQQKRAELKDTLQPSELHHPRAAFAASDVAAQAGSSATPQEEGERLFARGDYAGAAAAYRRALRDRPDSVLVRERLEELFQLARGSAPGSAATAEAHPAPADPVSELKAWLERISRRRRP